MSIRICTRLYRNRHGVFCYRLRLPGDLYQQYGQREFRLSTGTEQRQAALRLAVALNADLDALFTGLRGMSESDAKPPTADYFNRWMREIGKNVDLKERIESLAEENFELRRQLSGSIGRDRAIEVVKHSYTTGQLTGKQELENKLMFPPPPEQTEPFSKLQAAYLDALRARPISGRKSRPTAKTLYSYEQGISQFTKIMGDLRIGSINRAIVGKFFSTLRQLPPNISRRAEFKGKTLGSVDNRSANRMTLARRCEIAVYIQ